MLLHLEDPNADAHVATGLRARHCPCGHHHFGQLCRGTPGMPQIGEGHHTTSGGSTAAGILRIVTEGLGTA